MSTSIIVLASGNGSNFQAIIDAIANHSLNATIAALIVDRPCQAIERAEHHGINVVMLNRKNLPADNDKRLQHVSKAADLMVCAGYLSILPKGLIDAFTNKIINIHPSLLPKFGGKGMYGMRVHRAVIDAQESVSGCTVHYVDSGIDTGKIIAQSHVELSTDETPASLQKKVLDKEHDLLVATISKLIRGKNA